MSIWCSWDHIGTEPNRWADAQGRQKPRVPERGNVISYAAGFSNHYPDLSGSHERPAAIALAHIAPWCTPGHDEDCDRCQRRHDFPDAGQWLRLEVAAPETLNFWEKDDDGNPTVLREGATVILDITAATALRDDLNHWLDLNHLAAAE